MSPSASAGNIHKALLLGRTAGWWLGILPGLAGKLKLRPSVHQCYSSWIVVVATATILGGHSPAGLCPGT